ncbi:Serine/threonine protein kinase [Parasponia andersonii]|uniref:mitogen-activated protein kinase kinase kinase n=1 Tax=Parasponia andersonii TaxID=3476 RepID=A0A2P5A668_PARAD|nr:Serine/threonine protein kinase [Parasponia andersonii]
MDWSRGQTIGRGSSATVSIATSARSGHVFAVKSAELSQSKALQHEQSIISSLASAHVVSYIGQDITRENDKSMYNLLIEYMPGGTLNDIVSRHGGRLDESSIGYYTREIVRGLEYLHSLGIVHCDIKGRNILVGEKGPKIADFGCARPGNSAEPIAGTPMFMAPEVARGEHQGFSSDIWSLGCTIIEMASGGSPWPNAGDPIAILYRIAYSGELPEFPSFLSSEAKDFLAKCLRINPDERWTASQLLKHPFLGQFKQTNESNTLNSSSPTSILDQGIWKSLDESGSLSNLISLSSGGDSPADRIRRLSSSLFSGAPRWDLEESWITIRSNGQKSGLSSDYGEDDEADMVGGSGRVWGSFSCTSLSLETNFSDKNRAHIPDQVPQCREKSVVYLSSLILEKDRDKLLIPFSSIFLKF